MEEPNKEMEEEQHKQPRLRLVPGFKDGDGETPVTNWLLAMEKGTCFLARKKTIVEPFQEEYCVAAKGERSVHLYYEDHRGQGFIWVNAEVFTKMYICDEILGVNKVDGPR
jgi:hypothetical protein